jgi:hypothetical protein
MASIQAQISAINLVLQKAMPRTLGLTQSQFDLVKTHLQEARVSLEDHYVLLSRQEKDNQS